MKSIISVMFSTCVAVVVMSCNDNSTSDTTKTDSTSTMSSTPTDTSTTMTTPDNTSVVMIEAPATARTSFETKYKNAKNVTWKKYTPSGSTSKMDDYDYYSDLDTSYYQVNYNWNDLDYMAWYNPKGEWIKTYARMENNSSLPAAVNNAINKKFTGYKIIDVELEDRKKGMQYEVDLDNGTAKKKVVFSQSGAILKQKDK